MVRLFLSIFHRQSTPPIVSRSLLLAFSEAMVTWFLRSASATTVGIEVGGLGRCRSRDSGSEENCGQEDPKR
jgi:hypothetical protein